MSRVRPKKVPASCPHAVGLRAEGFWQIERVDRSAVLGEPQVAETLVVAENGREFLAESNRSAKWSRRQSTSRQSWLSPDGQGGSSKSKDQTSNPQRSTEKNDLMS